MYDVSQFGNICTAQWKIRVILKVKIVSNVN